MYQTSHSMQHGIAHPTAGDFDDVSIHSATEELEFTYPDSTGSEPSGDTTDELLSLNDGLVLSEHDENEMKQTEPMEIDEGVESYCYRCNPVYHGTVKQHDPECREHGYYMTHQRLEGPRYGYSRCDVATRIPIPGPSSALEKRLIYRLPHYTSVAPRYGDWRSHALASHMVLEYDTAPEEEDDRKPPAPEGDMDSKGMAPDEGSTAGKCPAADNGDADCSMIHLPNALETQI
jgi:hypothetical protein